MWDLIQAYPGAELLTFVLAGLALNLANERVTGKAGSPLAWSWMARAREACGDEAGSTQAGRHAGALRAA